MGNGWNEWPLVLFTVLSQCVVGGVIVTGIAWYRSAGDHRLQQAIVRVMLPLWLVLGAAFVISVMHPGSPWRAFNALNRLGASALSNEIAGGVLFFAAGGLWWLFTRLNRMPPGMGNLWLMVTGVLGLLFVWLMSRVYQIETVPLWSSAYTMAGFFLTVLLGGMLSGALLLNLAGYSLRGPWQTMLCGLALFIAVALSTLQGHEVASLQPSPVPAYGQLQVWRIALLTLGIGYWLRPPARLARRGTLTLLPALLLVVMGELIGRAIFYSLYMSVGINVVN